MTFGKRTRIGSSLEFAIAIPFVVMFIYAVITTSKVYYTHITLKQIATDTSNKTAILFRRNFALPLDSQTAEATAVQEIRNAILRENSEAYGADFFAFLNDPGGFTLNYIDLSTNSAGNYAGAITLYMDNGIVNQGGNNFAREIISYRNIDPEYTAFLNNCNGLGTAFANNRPVLKPMFFRPYQISIRFTKPITIRFFGANLSFNLEAESSDLLQDDLTLEEICSAAWSP